MLTLPHRYKGLFDREQEILGWKGEVLQTKVDGKVWTLTPKDTKDLLQYLGLKASDIPGKEAIQLPPGKKRVTATMEIEEIADDNEWETFPTRRGIVS